MNPEQIQSKLAQWDELSQRVKELEKQKKDVEFSLACAQRHLKEHKEQFNAVVSAKKWSATCPPNSSGKYLELYSLSEDRRLATICSDNKGITAFLYFRQTKGEFTGIMFVSESAAKQWVYDWLQHDGFTIIDLE